MNRVQSDELSGHEDGDDEGESVEVEVVSCVGPVVAPRSAPDSLAETFDDGRMTPPTFRVYTLSELDERTAIKLGSTSAETPLRTDLGTRIGRLSWKWVGAMVAATLAIVSVCLIAVLVAAEWTDGLTPTAHSHLTDHRTVTSDDDSVADTAPVY